MNIETINEVKTEETDFLQYDSLEDINNCLNCQKEECTNCLRFKNGV